MSDMRVTVMTVGDETLVHVSSSSVVTWQMVEDSLPVEVRAGLIGPMRYYPALRPTPQERQEGRWLCDQWVFGIPADALEPA